MGLIEDRLRALAQKDRKAWKAADRARREYETALRKAGVRSHRFYDPGDEKVVARVTTRAQAERLACAHQRRSGSDARFAFDRSTYGKIGAKHWVVFTGAAPTADMNVSQPKCRR